MLAAVVIALLGPLALSLLTTYLVRGWALRRDFVDRPSGHKRHNAPVALGGGIALFVSICGPLAVGTLLAWLLMVRSGLPSAPPPAWLPDFVQIHLEGIAAKLPLVLGIVGGAFVLHVMGLIDDRKPLGPLVKFGVQLAVAVFVVGVVGIRAVSALPAPLSMAITVLWIILITNAFNFMDNMDGLSAGVAAIAAAIFAVASAGAGQVFVPLMACVVVGALLGFLRFNFTPASIFMGDAGSLVVGFLMSVLTILTTYYDPQQGLTPLGVFVPIMVLAVPLYDVFSVVIHRIRLGQSPFRGDWRHFSHRLVRQGMSTRRAVLTIYLATAATALPAIILPRVNWVFASLLLLQCVCVVVMIAILEHSRAP